MGGSLTVMFHSVYSSSMTFSPGCLAISIIIDTFYFLNTNRILESFVHVIFVCILGILVRKMGLLGDTIAKISFMASASWGF